jgi:hypothetical protein
MILSRSKPLLTRPNCKQRKNDQKIIKNTALILKRHCVHFNVFTGQRGFTRCSAGTDKIARLELTSESKNPAIRSNLQMTFKPEQASTSLGYHVTLI